MKKFRVILCFAILCALLCSLAPCALAEAATLTVKKTELHLSVGEKFSLEPVIKPSTAKKAGYTCQSSNPGVASVDSKGRVTAAAVGNCSVTVTCNADTGIQAVVSVSVIVPVKKIKAEAAKSTIVIGEKTAVTCTYTPDNATLKSAVFTSSKPSVATVSDFGVITGVARGSATINVASADGKAKTSLTIKVQQAPESVEVKPSGDLSINVGEKKNLRANVLPNSAGNKKVVWASSDERIVSVNQNGRLTGVGPGTAVITVTCEANTGVSASLTVTCNQLAASVAFSQKEYNVVMNQKLQLGVIVSPDNTTNKSVTYHVKDPKIASVDENGVLTALKGGKTTVRATMADGSRKSAQATIQVIVPVQGVSLPRTCTRVGKGSYTELDAVFEPKNATNRFMTWVSSDESIATVTSNKKNEVRITGRAWGRCVVTGTTQDGGYTCSVNVNVGSLFRAVTVKSIEIRDGKPRIVFQNNSNMNITAVHFQIIGTNEYDVPIQMSTRGNTLYGCYEYPLAPGERTSHGSFTFYHVSRYDDLEYVAIAITGWETNSGYYDSDDNIAYSYQIPERRQEWHSDETELYRRAHEEDDDDIVTSED